MDKIFKIGLLIAVALILYLYNAAAQVGRYQAVTEYEGSLGILDTRQGIVYMLDIESDQWTLIKPFSPSRPVSSATPADSTKGSPVIFRPASRGL